MLLPVDCLWQMVSHCGTCYNHLLGRQILVLQWQMKTTGNSWCHCHCGRCNSQTKFHASWVYTHRKLGCACMADFPPNPLLKQQFKDGWISIVSKFFILILSWNWQGINTHLNDGIKVADSKDLVSQLIRHWWGVIKIFLHLGNVIKSTRKGGPSWSILWTMRMFSCTLQTTCEVGISNVQEVKSFSLVASVS